MNKLYELTYEWYDQDRHFYFQGPEDCEKSFDIMCEEMVPEAMAMAINDPELQERWIGWPEIVEKIAMLLPEYGFEPVKPINKAFCGSTIIEDDKKSSYTDLESFQTILKHNKRLKEDNDEQLIKTDQKGNI